MSITSQLEGSIENEMVGMLYWVRNQVVLGLAFIKSIGGALVHFLQALKYY